MRSDKRIEERLAAFRQEFDERLRVLLDDLCGSVEQQHPGAEALAQYVRHYALRTGKRLRPFLVWCGFRAAGGTNLEQAMPVAAAAEMLHVFALAHDDVMDRSDTRRGLPSAHKMAEEQHRDARLRGDPEQYGISTAILVGDLAFAWADTLIDRSDVAADALAAVRSMWDRTREEVILGQYMDVFASQQTQPASADQIWAILSLKSGKYTMERPLHLGASAAGAAQGLLDALSEYAVPLGRAFQLIDDLLGVFGSESETGKPADSDIREGKSTLMVRKTYDLADEAQKQTLLSVWGDPEADTLEVQSVRDIIESTGARHWTVERISELAEDARAALANIAAPADVTDDLSDIIGYLLSRRS